MNLRDGRLWLAGLYLLHFAALHLGFHAIYLDADQLLVADQAKWMSLGHFFEPFFFGQAYLLPFEAYLAVPLVWAGLSPLSAVKVMAALFFYLPFAWTACAHAKDRPWVSVAVTLMFFALPMEYLLAAPMPRGFIVACALAWLGLRALLLNRGQAWAPVLAWGALVGFCLGSYTSVALMVPALVLIDDRRRLLQAGVGLALGYALFKGVALFYVFHPEHVVHRFPLLRFTRGHLGAHLTNPTIAPAFAWLLGLGAAACAAVMALCWPDEAQRRAWALRLALLALGLVGVIGIMLSTNKIADFNAGTPFYSVYRLMLPLPYLALLVMSAAALRSPSVVRPPALATTVALGALFIGLVGWQAMGVQRDREALALLTSTVPPLPYDRLERQCARLAEALRVSGQPHYTLRGRNDALAYGCSAQFGLPVVQTTFERRTWLREHLERAAKP